ncbi:MAG: YggT family protein [Waddliaceae bacterium]
MLLVIIDRLFLVYMLMLFVRILSSWLPELQQYQFMRFIAYYTDPYFNFFRRFIPPLGMIDFSPIVGFLFLGVLEYVVKGIIFMLFYS